MKSMLVQRAHDGRWEKICQVVDEDFPTYYYDDRDGNPTMLVQTKWVTVAVYDFIMEEV